MNNNSKWVVVFGAFFSLILGTAMLAYNLSGYTWPSASATYDAHTLSSSFQSAVSYGVARWESASVFDWRSNSNSVNDVYLDSIDGRGGVYATTTTWRVGSWITKMRIRFDDGESWYTGSSTPASSKLDARSEATHELGHALGINHTQSNLCSSSTPESRRPTMCSGYAYGKIWKRTLEDDDENAIRALYDRSSLFSSSFINVSEETEAGESVSVAFSYEELSPAERQKASDKVLRGVITGISETKWNQDSGMYWEEASEDGTTMYTALPYFEIEIAHDGTFSTVTVLGASPYDSDEKAFSVGDEALLYVREADFAWRGGESRVILEPVGDPHASILLKHADGQFKEIRESE